MLCFPFDSSRFGFAQALGSAKVTFTLSKDGSRPSRGAVGLERKQPVQPPSDSGCLCFLQPIKTGLGVSNLSETPPSLQHNPFPEFVIS